MRRLSSALAFLLLLQFATPAWAWGRLGHRVAAVILVVSGLGRITSDTTPLPFLSSQFY